MLTSSIFLILKAVFVMIMQTPLLTMSSLMHSLIVYYFRLPIIFINYMEVNFYRISEEQIARF